MKITLKILMAFFLIVYGNLGAQEIITSNGDYFSNSNGSLSSTIGEPIGETFAGTENVITQGFQQSKLTIISIMEFTKADYTITAFPNPVKEYIKIKCDSHRNENLVYELYDNLGKLLQKKQIERSETEISFSNLKPSDYYIRILSGQSEVKTFKIVKQ
jgi:hypothetical protein